MLLAHLSRCFSLHVSTHSVLNASDIICILVLLDRSNNWSVVDRVIQSGDSPCGSDEVSSCLRGLI